MTAKPTPADNTRGILLMIAAMALFTIEDALIKWLAAEIPAGQIMIVIGLGGFGVLGARAVAQGIRLFDPALFSPLVLARLFAEMVGTAFFVSSLVMAPLSVVSAIIQVSPLIVTLGAALFLGETVGPRRWAAVGIGMVGMLLILRPGGEAFTLGAFFAFLGTLGLSSRDIITRRLPKTLNTGALSAWAFVAVLPAGVILLLFDPRPQVPDAGQWGILAACVIIGIFAYLAITTAMRVGEASAVAPFRYSRLIFALFIGALVFEEQPEALTLLGALIVVSSGIYTLWREAQLRRRA